MKLLLIIFIVIFVSSCGRPNLQRTSDNLNYVKKDGYILDKKNRLMWENGRSVAIKRTYTSAETACHNFTLGRFDDWRIPKIEEYISILNYKQDANVLPSDSFGYLRVSCYEIKGIDQCQNIVWTGSTILNGTKAYTIDIVNGKIALDDAKEGGSFEQTHTVRCVRNY